MSVGIQTIENTARFYNVVDGTVFEKTSDGNVPVGKIKDITFDENGNKLFHIKKGDTFSMITVVPEDRIIFSPKQENSDTEDEIVRYISTASFITIGSNYYKRCADGDVLLGQVNHISLVNGEYLIMLNTNKTQCVGQYELVVWD